MATSFSKEGIAKLGKLNNISYLPENTEYANIIMKENKYGDISPYIKIENTIYPIAGLTHFDLHNERNNITTIDIKAFVVRSPLEQ